MIMILTILDKILKKEKSQKLRSRTIIGILIITTVLFLVSGNLPGELIKNVTDSFSFGTYDSKIDGIRNNMGCATIVGKAETQGLACMQNVYNKCNHIKMYSFISSCLLFVALILLIFNAPPKESKGKYKISLFCVLVCLILISILNYITYILKTNSIKDENCGLKGISKNKMKYGHSYYLNLVVNALLFTSTGLMMHKYQNILF